jgi:hypothetical protein
MATSFQNEKVTVTENVDGKLVTTRFTQEEYKKYSRENLFKRIDPYHSIAYLTEEIGGREEGISISGYDVIEEFGWKELKRGELVIDESFPAWQDAIQTSLYTDDNYTYVVTNIMCHDFHVAPPYVGMILRLDKVVEEDLHNADHDGY